MLRVATTRELFDAAETLARLKPLRGERLAIVSNGGGPAVLATDALIGGEGALAELDESTLRSLNEVLPASWSRGNPVDIVGDAPAGRYVDALRVVLADPGVDAALLIHSPTAIVPAATVAEATASVIESSKQPILTCWMGGEAAREARTISSRSGVPTYSTPEESVDAFLHAGSIQPQPASAHGGAIVDLEIFVPQPEVVKGIIQAALAQGREMLTELEAKHVLSAYCIPVAKSGDVVNRRLAHELTAGITTDPTFGPVVVFGKAIGPSRL